ncbi:MAG: 4Fe-4S dicluster domain-containing protein [Deltaproteobacteria bacterium]|jgi:NAD-dependent dihydropyrimidine dehydrogenase PreA subunit|nr:4Fe-4S dicluster domain-containing protein [Deltaproteobacteria bacterium]
MIPIVYSDRLLCVGCNKCLRACPAPDANVVWHDQSGRVIVSIDHLKCVNCGSCIRVCNHGARKYKDDLGRFLSDLKAGKRVALIVDSTVRSNFPNHPNLFRFLKSLGVSEIHDGSLGLELFAWAHLKYLTSYRPFSLITSYCPVVIAYCRKHRPELLPRLSPVMGPLLCQTLYLREHLGVKDPIAVLGPCPTLTANSDEGNRPNYNVTFARLESHLAASGVDLSEYGPDRDEELGPVPRILPVHPSLKRIVKTHLDPNLRVDTARGRGITSLLDEYAKAEVETLPSLFNLYQCRDGCAMGLAACPGNSLFRARTILDDAKRDFTLPEAMAHVEASFRHFEENLSVELFTERYSPQRGPRDSVSDDELERSFQLLGKDPGPDRHFDCGYCGNATCLDMARSIALRNNIPDNCVTRIRIQNKENLSKSTTHLELIQSVSEYLLLSVGKDYNSNVEHALMALCYSMDAFSAILWKNAYDEEERPVCQRMVTYPSKLTNSQLVHVTAKDPPGWLEALMEGGSIMRLKSNMSKIEQQKFLGRNVNAILLTPIIAHGDFWGFLSLMRQEEKLFNEEDIAVISICSNILASSLINQNLQGGFLDINLNLM